MSKAKSGVIEFSSVKPGDVKAVCSICGHRGNGVMSEGASPLTLRFEDGVLTKGTVSFTVSVGDGVERVWKVPSNEQDDPALYFRHSICFKCLSASLFREAEACLGLDAYDEIYDTPPEVVEGSFRIGKSIACTEEFIKGFKPPGDIKVFSKETYETKKLSEVDPVRAAAATKKFEEAKANLLRAAETAEESEKKKQEKRS
jgi:hypothetical protein